MNLLLDTHTLAWWLVDSDRLSATARAAIADAGNSIFVSAASAWELSTKVRIGRWPEAQHLVTDLQGLLQAEGFQQLAVSIRHCLIAGGLAGEHRDPFDRMLCAQALAEDMKLVTLDPAMAMLGAPAIW